ncbi:hypothetical protein CSKR_200201, partial [Clonorchis sinensis]
MVGHDYIELFDKLSIAYRPSMEDFADVINSLTAILFLLAGVLITVKQYALNSISCYIPVKPTGDNYNEYLSNYCWVHGTIPLHPREAMPQTPEVWDEYDRLRRIS